MDYIHKIEKYKAMKECCYCDFGVWRCRKGHCCSGYKRTVKSKWQSQHRKRNNILKEISKQMEDYMRKNILVLFKKLSDCKDSLLFDSGEQIATYGTKDTYVSLEVYGEVKVIYKNQVYHSACEMPPELLEIFKSGDYGDDSNVEVLDNNWFDYVYVKNGQPQSNDYVCESDISSMLESELETEMAEYLRYFEEELS